MHINVKHLLILTIFCISFGIENINAQVIVKDSSLEIGPVNPYWVQQSTHFSKTICDGSCGNIPGVEALSGTYFIWLGGSNVLEEGSAKQSIIIPNKGFAKLSFHFKAPIMAANVDDYFKVFMDSTVIFFANATDSSTYKDEYITVIVDVSSYADGNQHTLKFFGHQTGNPRVTHYLVDDITIKTTVGIKESTNLSEIKIYPNPAEDFVFLKIDKPQKINIRISSAEGKVVLKQTFKGILLPKIYISDLPKGFYLITIENENQTKVIRKLIVK